MSNDRPPTDFFVAAHARIAAQECVPMTVIRRGDPSVGTIILKINTLDGNARVLVEVRYGDDRIWTPATSTDPMPNRDADACLARQAEADPDAWLVEIEDKKGRVWFPGKVVSL